MVSVVATQGRQIIWKLDLSYDWSFFSMPYPLICAVLPSISCRIEDLGTERIGKLFIPLNLTIVLVKVV